MGIELYNQGFRTFEVPATQELTPKALQSLASGGVDGILVVRTTGRKYDQLPESASVRLVRTQTGETVASFTWSNPVSGVPVTPADQTVRKKLTEVARELVQTLLQTVPKPPA
jgi:DNA-binding LacI/PurR family transcriptional regulator